MRPGAASFIVVAMSVTVVRRVAACAAILLAVVVATAGAQQQGSAISYELTGTIDPATAGWVGDALDEARDEGAQLVIFRLDTPGGLDTSMREIVREIIASPVPVAVHVAPSGARAASAGLFVTLAADAAAMSPGTNIGAATPVSLGGGEQEEVLGRKIRNDAAAYVRALATGRGRDADLAERMVRDAVSVPAERAEEEGLVDVIAADGPSLLRALDGFRTSGPGAQRLSTDGLRLDERDMPLSVELRQLLVNPTVSYLLLLAGLLLLALELLSPGSLGPGLFGAVALLLGLYGTAQLPLDVTGVLLLVLGLALLAAETQVPSGGLLGGAGVVALIAAGILLYDTDSDVFEVSVPIVAAVGAGLGALTLFAASKALAARRAPVLGGPGQLVGQTAEVRVPLDPVGQVFVEGALWRARGRGFDHPPARGEHVRVEAVEDLTLTVIPKEEP